MDMCWSPAVDTVSKWISARLDRPEEVVAVLIGEHAPAAAEIGIDGSYVGVVAVAVTSARIGLPHLDECVRDRSAVSVEEVTMDHSPSPHPPPPLSSISTPRLSTSSV